MMHRAVFPPRPGSATGHRVSTRLALISRIPSPGTFPHRLFTASYRPRDKCCAKEDESAPKDAALQVTSLGFWSVKPAWKRASINTLRCLFGCTIGDFTALWLLQAFYSDLGMSTVMAVSSKPPPTPLPQLL